MTELSADTVLSVRRIGKSFPGVKALSEVSIDLNAGQVHALVGENGAGKSTLVNIIAGLQSPDSGDMLIKGTRYMPSGRKDAERHGVRIVMQELNLVNTLSIAENIFLGNLPCMFGMVNYAALNAAAEKLTHQVGLSVDPGTPVGRLSVGQQQMVEIAAGLSQTCDILILDEPTASLTDKEAALLFAQLEKLKQSGTAILYITHHIDEIMRIADCVTILRDGQHVSTHPIDELNADRIVRKMVGRDLEQTAIRRDTAPGEVVLKADNLCRRKKVCNVSFQVRRGEILGIAGLMGSGRTEMLRLLFGADKPDSGSVYLYNSKVRVTFNSPRQAVRHGIALVTEDRKEQGLLLPLSISENITLTHLGPLSCCGFISDRRETKTAVALVDKLSVKIASVRQAVGSLSGGNQQKIVIAKWLYRDCSILLFDEPTRGIDVGAKFEIYRMLGVLAGQGKALIIVSSDLKELMAISDRIAVMSAGKMTAVFGRDDWSEEKIAAAAFSEYINQIKTEA